MTEGYTIRDVTRDLGFLLTLTKLYVADEDNFWYDWAQKERFRYRIDANDELREIANYQDPLPKGNYHFFNPFADGFGPKSPAVLWYYKCIRAAFNLNVSQSIRYVMSSLLESKEAATNKTEYSLPSSVLRISSLQVDRKQTLYDVVDEKMLDEFEKISERTMAEGFHIPYSRPMMEAKVTNSALSDDKWDEKWGEGIRKKSLVAYKTILMGLLGITKPEDLSKFSEKYDPKTKSAAQFHTIMTVYLRLYSCFNDIIAEAWTENGEIAAHQEINLGELAAVIDRFPLAYAIAKHMAQPVLPKTAALDVKPVDTSKMSLSNGSQNARKFGGPQIVDEYGRTAAPQSLSLGLRNEKTSRFTPEIVEDRPFDPFAPAVAPAPSGFRSVGYGTTYPQQGSYFGGGGGLDVSPSAMFNTPGFRRSYF